MDNETAAALSRACASIALQLPERPSTADILLALSTAARTGYYISKRHGELAQRLLEIATDGARNLA